MPYEPEHQFDDEELDQAQLVEKLLDDPGAKRTDGVRYYLRREQWPEIAARLARGEHPKEIGASMGLAEHFMFRLMRNPDFLEMLYDMREERKETLLDTLPEQTPAMILLRKAQLDAAALVVAQMRAGDTKMAIDILDRTGASSPKRTEAVIRSHNISLPADKETVDELMATLRQFDAEAEAAAEELEHEEREQEEEQTGAQK